MGIRVPTYAKTGSTLVPTILNNVYISLRFENLTIQHNSDGTYTIQGRAKVYQNNTDMFVVDMANYYFVLTKDQLNAPLHQLIYTQLKKQFPGSTDAI